MGPVLAGWLHVTDTATAEATIESPSQCADEAIKGVAIEDAIKEQLQWTHRPVHTDPKAALAGSMAPSTNTTSSRAPSRSRPSRCVGHASSATEGFSG